jgi:hypothetical protein
VVGPCGVGWTVLVRVPYGRPAGRTKKTKEGNLAGQLGYGGCWLDPVGMVITLGCLTLRLTLWMTSHPKVDVMSEHRRQMR